MKIKFNINNIKVCDNSKYLTNKDYDYLVNYFNKNRLKQFDFLKEHTYYKEISLETQKMLILTDINLNKSVKCIRYLGF